MPSRSSAATLPPSPPAAAAAPLHTPDGRYLVVRGRLWRCANPALPEADRERWVAALMTARRQLRGEGAPQLRADARAAVQASKVALGERGPVWWHDGAPDLNRHLVRNTPYADWYSRETDPGQSAP